MQPHHGVAMRQLDDAVLRKTFIIAHVKALPRLRTFVYLRLVVCMAARHISVAAMPGLRWHRDLFIAIS